MAYQSLNDCILDLEKNGHLIRIKEEVDPYLEMAAIHLKQFEKGAQAVLFENIKGCKYKAVSNLFGTIERSKFMFRDTFEPVKNMVALRNNPMAAIKKPWRYLSLAISAIKALPKKGSFKTAGFEEIQISDLPLIHHWPMDGGAFITLPQVYSEDIDQPGVMNSNLGMYRIQLNGNSYDLNKEIGLHYQLHRGIGVHQSKTNKQNKPLKVSVFIGGPPAHSLAAVMPLPEGISELTFAGAMAGKRFKYDYHDGFCISLDADFVITGEVYPNENKPEGPFGDHLGYYSLQHPFPLMRVHKVFAKQNAIWPFTVVGRPPQEDTAFGALIHEISGSAIPNEIPGLKEINAVDAAGVHPLLLAVGSERYTPFLINDSPAELLTQANHILGTGQLSLAKYLIISGDPEKEINCHNIKNFFKHVFERIDLRRDLHFYTKTSIDTLDYSGNDLNQGSKLVMAAYGKQKRELSLIIPDEINTCEFISKPALMMDGVIAIMLTPFTNYSNAKLEIKNLSDWIEKRKEKFNGIVQIIIYDDFVFKPASDNLNDYVWITYTRSNPSYDIYGVGEKTENKHWSCDGPMIIDARKKAHHAPELKLSVQTEKSIERFFKV
jgi:4-hydroxy-3-polyprenylbenzoate decarboxylase